MNIASGNIKVFPSTNRNENTDSIYLTEENIISLVNRFTGGNSFVIDGMQLSEDGTTLSAGSCCINGYYFKILNDVEIKDIAKDTGTVFYAQISKITNTITTTEKYTELDGSDSDSEYTGLKFNFSDEAPESKDNTYNLILAIRTKNTDKTYSNWENVSNLILDNPYYLDDGMLS